MTCQTKVLFQNILGLDLCPVLGQVVKVTQCLKFGRGKSGSAILILTSFVVCSSAESPISPLTGFTRFTLEIDIAIGTSQNSKAIICHSKIFLI